LFSFAIDISDDEGEEASSSQAVGISSAEIEPKLEDCWLYCIKIPLSLSMILT